MTVPLYTDEDLRSEAAHCLLALSSSPSVADIRRSLPGAYVDSHREDDGSGHTWGDLLDDEGLTSVAAKIHALTEDAAHLPWWAVNLGADGLEPSDGHTITLDNEEKPMVRIHFAFDPSMPGGVRTDLVRCIRDALHGVLAAMP